MYLRCLLATALLIPSVLPAANPEELSIRLANDIIDSAEVLRVQFDRSYRGTPQHRSLSASVDKLSVNAAQILSLVHASGPALRGLRGNLNNMADSVERIHDFLDRSEKQGYRSRNRGDKVHAELDRLEDLVRQLKHWTNVRIQQLNGKASGRNPNHGGGRSHAGHDHPRQNPGHGGRPHQKKPEHHRHSPASNPWHRNDDRDFPRPPDPRDVFRFIFGPDFHYRRREPCPDPVSNRAGGQASGGAGSSRNGKVPDVSPCRRGPPGTSVGSEFSRACENIRGRRRETARVFPPVRRAATPPAFPTPSVRAGNDSPRNPAGGSASPLHRRRSR